MKPLIKELIDELISFRNERKPGSLLKSAYDALGQADLFVLVGQLLQWHKEVLLELREPDHYPIQALYPKYVTLFGKCSELNQVFSLSPDRIGFAPGLSESEQMKIRDYIHEHYKVTVRFIKKRK